jgi:hypothetical protein
MARWDLISIVGNSVSNCIVATNATPCNEAISLNKPMKWIFEPTRVHGQKVSNAMQNRHGGGFLPKCFAFELLIYTTSRQNSTNVRG